ncbi:hypothetical protein [Lentibacillus salicampi]|uniref:DUF5683 domain-containing protein n=1 Tax=Lentibacillus salicampi TaxID=175306 RepID=A0A4Y9ABX3_9BACI|nr:hypothetical protein [Lentibacillus salicampi]TFJ92420.1 hypothetical protein E4U82_12275 [Lentibacillus salicampi]
MKKGDITYKSPMAALLWSFALPGFGQFYNRDYFLGLVLVSWEILINLYSNLNIALMHTFHGDFQTAHDIINYEWGLFYPSVFAFSLWQAYNKARAITYRYEHQEELRKVYHTGLFFGLTAGMTIGLTTHHLYQVKGLQFLAVPVYSGLFFGIVGGVLGHLIEKCAEKWRERNSRQSEH